MKNNNRPFLFHGDFNHVCRVLVRRARKLAQQYFLVYQEPIPTGQLVQRVASVMQEYTQSGYVWCISTVFWKLLYKQLFRSVVHFEKMRDVHVPKWQWHNVQLFCFDAEEFGHLGCHSWSLAGMKTAHTFSSLTPRYATHFTVIISFIGLVKSSLK